MKTSTIISTLSKQKIFLSMPAPIAVSTIQCTSSAASLRRNGSATVAEPPPVRTLSTISSERSARKSRCTKAANWAILFSSASHVDVGIYSFSGTSQPREIRLSSFFVGHPVLLRIELKSIDLSEEFLYFHVFLYLHL